jgi:hypothetical protein
MERRGSLPRWVGRLFAVAAAAWVLGVCVLGLSTAQPAAARPKYLPSLFGPLDVGPVDLGSLNPSSMDFGALVSSTTDDETRRSTTTRVHRTTTTTRPDETTTTEPETTTTTRPPPLPLRVANGSYPTIPPRPRPPTTTPRVSKPTTTTSTTAPAPTRARVRALPTAVPVGTLPVTVTAPPPRAHVQQTTPSTNLMHEPLVLSSGSWHGVSMAAATRLGVPIAFGLLVGVFALGQALIDRRDPKLVNAPARIDEDSVPFE